MERTIVISINDLKNQISETHVGQIPMSDCNFGVTGNTATTSVGDHSVETVSGLVQIESSKAEIRVSARKVGEDGEIKLSSADNLAIPKDHLAAVYQGIIELDNYLSDLLNRETAA
jgi:hypothetical protein